MLTGTATLLLAPSRLPGTLRNLALWRRLRKDPRARATWDQHFQPSEYLRIHADVARAQVSPLLHFLILGNDELRQPSSSTFDMRYYLGRYPDVRAAGVNALLHYALFGTDEDRTLNWVQPPPSSAPAPAVLTEDAAPLPVRYINNQWRDDYPLVSVVIPCFNYGRFLEAALRSVLNQTFCDLEIIVVEGGSTDGTTPAEVRRLEALNLPRTQFYYREGRHLVGDNRNFGIARARGRYISCLDADDLLQPVYLEVAVFLAETYGYDFVYPSLQSFGDSNLRWLIVDPSFSQNLSENQVTTVALFRRAAWAHVGGIRDWNLGPQYTVEDWDFWMRLLGHGFRGKSIREPLLLYRVHSSGLTATAKTNMDEQRPRLHAANRSLIQSFEAVPEPAVFVANPEVNLPPLPDSSERPGFLLALPFVTIGGAEKLFQTIAKSIVDRGERLIVVTSLTLPESIPHDDACFDASTSNVYHLSRLFQTEAERRAFVSYLIRRYRVRTLLMAGSEFIYHWLPDLARAEPDLAVVDQLFNDTVHVFNNRHYSDYIGATIVPSEQLRDALIKIHGADPEKIEVIPHGIHTEPQDPAASPDPLPEAARGKTIVAYFGRLSPEKAPDSFVKIVRELASHRDLFFVMTGQGPDREKVMDQIRDYGLKDRIYTPGFVPSVAPLMRAADVIVLPSRIDGMPLAVLEALALGKPVVASRIGSLPEMIDDGVSGFLCDPEDLAGFCAKILRLARDPDLRRRMGEAGQASIARKYSAQAMLDHYARVIEAVRSKHLAGEAGDRSSRC